MAKNKAINWKFAIGDCLYRALLGEPKELELTFNTLNPEIKQRIEKTCEAYDIKLKLTKEEL